MPTNGQVRLAAVGDLHYKRGGQAGISWLGLVADAADVLLLCGDLTDYGRVEEARELARELTTSLRDPDRRRARQPRLRIGPVQEVAAALGDVGVHVLDGDTCEVLGVGFAGIKGFAGGFGRGALGPWGEPVIKQFVQEAITEALKLENARSRACARRTKWRC